MSVLQIHCNAYNKHNRSSRARISTRGYSTRGVRGTQWVLKSRSTTRTPRVADYHGVTEDMCPRYTLADRYSVYPVHVMW